MPHSYGYRARTRDMFSKGFRTSGIEHMSTYLTTYKRGDFVDIKVNPAIHKGMPFKAYHGRTGKIFNVTKRAVGVQVNKQVNGRILRKRIHVRIEHVHHSKCQNEIKRRIKQNEAIKADVRAGKAQKQNLKRSPELPLPGRVVKVDAPMTIQPIPHVDLI